MGGNSACGLSAPPGPGSSPSAPAGPGPTLPPLVVVVCVPGGLRSEVVDACHRSGLPVHILTHQRQPPTAYAEVLLRLWAEPWEWVLVEQDAVPDPAALRAMVTCRHEWCSCPHWIGSHWDTRTLGCARFSLQLRRRLPRLVEAAAEGWPRSWAPAAPVQCDVLMARQLAIAGVPVHVHPNPTRHLRQYGVELEPWVPGEGPEA